MMYCSSRLVDWVIHTLLVRPSAAVVVGVAAVADTDAVVVVAVRLDICRLFSHDSAAVRRNDKERSAAVADVVVADPHNHPHRTAMADTARLMHTTRHMRNEQHRAEEEN